jgi:dTDP-4-amino-4,6-dideoxygalactose transaminase
LFVNSATSALQLIFHAVDLPPGSEVIVPDFTFNSTALAPASAGYRVVLADVDPYTGLITPEALARAMTPRTSAVIAVDYAGRPAPYTEIEAICDSRDIVLVSDAAQSIGAVYKGRYAGTFGVAAVFSFHGTKNLPIGEGGAVLCEDVDLHARIRLIADKGMDRSGIPANGIGFAEFVGPGFSFVQAEIVAALGRSRLKHLDAENAARRNIAKIYMKELMTLDIDLPPGDGDYQSNWHIFYILVQPERRDSIISGLRQRGVMANTHYRPLHDSPYWAKQSVQTYHNYSGADHFARSMIRVPIYASLSETEIDYVIQSVREVL